MKEATPQPNYATPQTKIGPTVTKPEDFISKDKTDNKLQILNKAAHQNP